MKKSIKASKALKNILKEVDYLEIQSRIKKDCLRRVPDSGARWKYRKCLFIARELKLAIGEIPFKKQGPSILRSKLGRLFSNLSWPKGAVTPTEMNTKTVPFSLTDFDTEKNELLSYLEQVRTHSSFEKHPFFGDLKMKEWARLIYKTLIII